MDWSIVQEPLQLIAHVIKTDKPYRQILTADYTMVNMATDPIYRAGTGFSENYTDENGFYDRSEFREFRPGTNNGQVPMDDDYERTDDEIVIYGPGGPTPAFSARMVGALSVHGYESTAPARAGPIFIFWGSILRSQRRERLIPLRLLIPTTPP